MKFFVEVTMIRRWHDTIEAENQSDALGRAMEKGELEKADEVTWDTSITPVVDP